MTYLRSNKPPNKDMAKAMASGVGYNARALHHNFERMHLF